MHRAAHTTPLDGQEAIQVVSVSSTIKLREMIRTKTGCPKKITFRMLLELSRAASGKVTSARFLDKVTLPEFALLSSNSILKVHFFWDTLYKERMTKLPTIKLS